MRWIRLTACVAAVVLWLGVVLGSTPQLAAAQEPVEEIRRLSLADVRLPPGMQPQTKEYSIFHEVRLVDRFYRFTIDSPHATYRMYGLPDLVRTIHEIRVVEATQSLLDALLGRSRRARSRSEKVKATVDGAKSAVLHPLETGKDLGRNLQKLGGTLKKKLLGRKGVTQQPYGVLSEPPLARAYRARVAASLTLDVDSPNPYVQRLIDDTADAYRAGKLTFRPGFLLTPFRRGGAAVPPAVPVLPTTNYALPPHANLQQPEEAPARVAGDFARFGVDAAIVKRILSNPAFSASQLLRLRDAVSNLSYVQGLARRLERLASLPDRITVEYALRALELIRAEHLAHGSIYGLNRSVATERGNLVIDFVRDGEEGVIVEVSDLVPKDALFIGAISRLAAARREGALQKVAFWCTCALTPAARDYSRRLGVPVHELVTMERIKAGL